LIQVQGYSAAAVGFALLPMTVLMVVLSFIMSRVIDRYGPRLPLIVGPLLISLSFVMLATLQPESGQDTYWATLFPAICLFGAGMGVTLAPLTTAVMASVDEHHAGMASGLNNTVSRSAQVVAIAVMGGIVLVLFKQSLLSDPSVIALPADARALLSAESVKLAEPAPPATLTAMESAYLQDLIRETFSGAINVIMWIAAGLSLLSGLLAALLIERELPFPE